MITPDTTIGKYTEGVAPRRPSEHDEPDLRKVLERNRETVEEAKARFRKTHPGWYGEEIVDKEG